MTRPVESFAQRLRAARDARQLTQGQLATAAGVKQPDISKMELGLIQKTTAMARLSRALGVAAEWLEFGEGPAPDWSTREAESQGYGFPPQAHDASHQESDDDSPLLGWEAILSMCTPERFRAVLPDDALAPEYPKGTEILWTTKRQALPGRIALVKDVHGQLHARMLRQGRTPGQVEAVAKNDAFLSFDGIQDAFSVVAVFKGRMEPDDL